jgi:hypothetical protein
MEGVSFLKNLTGFYKKKAPCSLFNDLMHLNCYGFHYFYKLVAGVPVNWELIDQGKNS